MRADWIDRNGHMNVGYYHVAFDNAAEPFFEWRGCSKRMPGWNARGRSGT